MPFVTVAKENSGNIDLYYEDHGFGKPIILIHGYPLSGASWEKQLPALLNAGYRVITYDRRGFGKSSQPTIGYNYDTFTEDLRKLITHLGLKNFALVGFSMGGGEIARYFGKYGSEGVSKAVIIGGIPPFLLKTHDNPDGLDSDIFQGIQKAVAVDRYAFFTEFFKNFYNTDLLLGKRVSQDVVQASWNIAVGASATASLACVPTWHEDFRQDLSRVDIPTLVIHGDDDRIVPIGAAGQRTAQLINGALLHVVKGGPHCIPWTHAEDVNAELLSFLGGNVSLPPRKQAYVTQGFRLANPSIYGTLINNLADVDRHTEINRDDHLLQRYTRQHRRQGRRQRWIRRSGSCRRSGGCRRVLTRLDRAHEKD